VKACSDRPSGLGQDLRRSKLKKVLWAEDVPGRCGGHGGGGRLTQEWRGGSGMVVGRAALALG
jgi:hypothetical protein